MMIIITVINIIIILNFDQQKAKTLPEKSTSCNDFSVAVINDLTSRAHLALAYAL